MELQCLLLCNKPQDSVDANTIVDHISAFETYSKHKVWLCSSLGDLADKFSLHKFDVIIIHYSLFLLNNYYIGKKTKERLRKFKGLKVIFIQDEYRRVNDMIQELAYLNIDVLFTCFPKHEIDRIYSTEKLPNLSKYTNLTGYIPERLLNFPHKPKIADRKIDVAYRGRKLPYWYGELAYEKSNIVDLWHEKVKDPSIIADISYDENKRIYGNKWIAFLLNAKSTLGVESGASVIDFTGELEQQVNFHQAVYPFHSFEKVQPLYLSKYEGLYQLNQISPRCFEAIALKTALVLFEGSYSGILIPDRHYIPLKKDYSNIDQVLEKIKNNVTLQKLVDTAYDEIALNPEYTYQAFIQYVDTVISNEFSMRNKKKVKRTYDLTQYHKDLQSIALKIRLLRKLRLIYQRMPLSLQRVVRAVRHPVLALKFIKRNLLMQYYRFFHYE